MAAEGAPAGGDRRPRGALRGRQLRVTPRSGEGRGGVGRRPRGVTSPQHDVTGGCRGAQSPA